MNDTENIEKITVLENRVKFLENENRILKEKIKRLERYSFVPYLNIEAGLLRGSVKTLTKMATPTEEESSQGKNSCESSNATNNPSD